MHRKRSLPDDLIDTILSPKRPKITPNTQSNIQYTPKTLISIFPSRTIQTLSSYYRLSHNTTLQPIPNHIQQFMDKIYIVWDSDQGPTTPPTSLRHIPSRSISDLIVTLISTKLNQSKSSLKHVLALGYRIQEPGIGNAIKGTNNIECHFPNTLHSFFQSDIWQQLFQIIGDRNLYHLLSRTLMFFQLANHNFVQISGEFLPELIRLRKDPPIQSQQQQSSLISSTFNQPLAVESTIIGAHPIAIDRPTPTTAITTELILKGRSNKPKKRLVGCPTLDLSRKFPRQFLFYSNPCINQYGLPSDSESII